MIEQLSRSDLITRAQALGVQRAELLTRSELKDEILRLSEPDETKRRRSRGWLGAARDLLAGVVEAGLHLPDAAKLIRGQLSFGAPVRGRAPVATVTLAEIYAAQGHTDRALDVLAQVLASEPEHEMARAVRNRLMRERGTEEPAPEELAPSKSDAQEPSIETREASPPAEPVREPEAPAVSGVPSDAATAQISEDVLIVLLRGIERYLYWEITERSLQRAREQAPDGEATATVIFVQPDWNGGHRIEQAFSLDTRRGMLLISSQPENAAVRGAIGWRSSQGFRPFAVGIEFRLQGETELHSELVWGPWVKRGEPLTRALERAIRSFESRVQT